MSIFSTRLKIALKNKNMRQSELCTLTGIPKSAMSQYVSGAFFPKQERLRLISEALNIPEVWLLGYDINLFEEHNNSNLYSISQHIKNIETIYPKNITNTYTKVPILGHVAAGIPISVQEDIIGYEEVPTYMSQHDTLFALQIKGDSMEPKFENGDTVIVKQQSDVDNNQIAIVMIGNNDTTCKRVLKYPDGIMLISTNPQYPPMQFTNKQIAELPVVILGKVIELRSKFL